MTAALALQVAEQAGIRIDVRNGVLALAADVPPPPAVIELLRQHKTGIILLIAPWSPEDWQTFYDERAAIREHDGGVPRAEADAGALKETIAELLRLHFRSPPSIGCRHCFSKVAGAPPEPSGAVTAAKRSKYRKWRGEHR